MRFGKRHIKILCIMILMVVMIFVYLGVSSYKKTDSVSCRPIGKGVLRLIDDSKVPEAYAKLDDRQGCSEKEKNNTEAFGKMSNTDQHRQVSASYELAKEAYSKGDRESAVRLGQMSLTAFKSMNGAEKDKVRNFIQIAMDVSDMKEGIYVKAE